MRIKSWKKLKIGYSWNLSTSKKTNYTELQLVTMFVPIFHKTLKWDFTWLPAVINIYSLFHDGFAHKICENFILQKIGYLCYQEYVMVLQSCDKVGELLLMILINFGHLIFKLQQQLLNCITIYEYGMRRWALIPSYYGSLLCLCWIQCLISCYHFCVNICPNCPCSNCSSMWTHAVLLWHLCIPVWKCSPATNYTDVSILASLDFVASSKSA